MEFFKYILFFILGVISLFIILITINMLYYRFAKKIKPIKKEGKPYRPTKLLYKLFIQFPKRYALDRLTFNPNHFPYKGFWLFVGKQGKGKTISLVYTLMEIQKQYPLCQVDTNFYYKYQNGEINHWKNIVFRNNGEYGQICAIDEIQNWFNSLQSKNFPPELITEICQQRKARKIICGTSQLFTRVAKPLREQCYLLFYPTTIFGCFTIVRVVEPTFDDSANIVSQKIKKIFCFVHTKEIRESYDTYLKIAKMADDGFKDESEQMRVDTNNNVNNFIYVDNKGGKK